MWRSLNQQRCRGSEAFHRNYKIQSISSYQVRNLFQCRNYKVSSIIGSSYRVQNSFQCRNYRVQSISGSSFSLLKRHREGSHPFQSRNYKVSSIFGATYRVPNLVQCRNYKVSSKFGSSSKTSSLQCHRVQCRNYKVSSIFGSSSKTSSLQCHRVQCRNYKVLAIESSCDDSCVALLEKHSPHSAPKVIDQFKATLNSTKDGGIIPVAAQVHHQTELADLVHQFCRKHNLSAHSPPDLVCCTRGPGMASSLSAGLQFAKGLTVAWNRPLVGVHHMLGHLLIANLPKQAQPDLPAPRYPFLSLLCSGGHTMLVLSKSITDHEVIINTSDIAAGDSLDKCAREIIGLKGNMLGKELEKYLSDVPNELKEQFSQINTHDKNNEYEFQLKLPLRGPHSPRIPSKIEFSFAMFLSVLQHYKSSKVPEGQLPDEPLKQFLAFKMQESIFDHIIDRINVALVKHGLGVDAKTFGDRKFAGVRDFICSGGVAANLTLRNKLHNELKLKENLGIEPTQMNFHFPDLSLCTDNAIMIGVAGIEIYEKLRLKSNYKILPIRKWPLNELLEPDGWVDVSETEFNETCKYND